MRTVSDQVDRHHFGMENFSTTQILVGDHRRRLEGAADQYRLVRQLPPARRAPLRTEAGWMLVRAGLRLARIDAFRAAPLPVTPAQG
ncbi:MAG TPA: hypothetical protein VHT30_07575 [Acidimicrobiales bacterium]|jgi:hypothetical protein|nr:hypothetical protein [Acidimicrobiales bacterium]